MAALTGNKIGAEGAKALAEAILQCTSLQHLNLWGKATPCGFAGEVWVWCSLKRSGDESEAQAAFLLQRQRQCKVLVAQQNCSQG
eukprot:scaffold117486_cov19-Prasinocladus_malaysianus.AAC.1